MTVRAWLIGGIVALSIACFAPINDFYLHNTLLYGNFLPPVVLVLALALGLVVNPLLGRHRLQSREVGLVLALTLIVGGVVCTGLNRQFTAVIAAPAKLIPNDLSMSRLIDREGVLPVPRGMFVGVEDARAPDQNSATYRQVVEGFHIGGRTGEPVPWRPWLAALAHWTPLLVALTAIAIGLATVVRQQWLHHERIAYPIASIISQLSQEPEPGRAVPALLRNRVFWLGFGIVFAYLLTSLLYAAGWLPIALPRTILGPPGLAEIFEHTTYTGGHLAKLDIFFSTIGISFLLASELSFSLWSVFLGANVLFALGLAFGLPIVTGHVAVVGLGAFVAEFFFVAWIGRLYYWRVLRAAFGFDPTLDRSLRIWARVLVAGLVGLWLFLVVVGAPVWAAAAVTLLTLIGMTVMGRLVAEAGIPLITTPVMLNDLIATCFGAAFPPAAVVPLLLTWMITDARENVAGFAVNAVVIGEEEQKHPGLRPAGLGLIALVAALLVALVMIWLCYAYDGMQARDSWWRYTFQRPMQALADAADGGRGSLLGDGWVMSCAVGAGILTLLAVLRTRVSGWPLHPLGFILGVSMTGTLFWFSVLVGWLARSLVMRYGGVALYRKLVPLAIGAICGEAGCSFVVMLIQIIGQMCGHPLTDVPKFMP